MWRDNYRIGIELIDAQHKKLFGMVEETRRIMNESDYDAVRRMKCRDAVDFMKAYVEMHFSDEESYMESIGYPELTRHQQIHQEFRERIVEEEEKLETSQYREDVMYEFIHMLEMWLINHVTNEDQLIAKAAK